METHARVYSTQKGGNALFDNQDAFGTPVTDADGYCKLDRQRFAIADGATEAIFSGPWARILSQAWVTDEFSLEPERFLTELEALSLRWRASVPDRQEWWAEQKVAAGAFSTLCGLELVSDRLDHRWVLRAVGDSCLFVVRQNTIVFSGPLDRSEQFSSSPFLLASSPERNVQLSDHLFTAEGRLERGDELILATDALAFWILAQVESGTLMSELLQFEETSNPKGAFIELVDNLRGARGMKNDDVTLLSIHLL